MSIPKYDVKSALLRFPVLSSRLMQSDFANTCYIRRTDGTKEHDGENSLRVSFLLI